MPTRGCWALALIIAGGIAAAGCESGSVDYTATITEQRDQKDRFFRDDANQSPVRREDATKFLPLSYFPIDESYSVPAQLAPAPQRDSFTMPTSTGTLREVERIGTLRFSLQGQPLQLSAFLEKGSQELFVPFSDQTSGTETYNAGRYLNLGPTASGVYLVDFNAAYNPYCYYNAEYECPLPPAENRLPLPVRAGERMRQPDPNVPR